MICCFDSRCFCFALQGSRAQIQEKKLRLGGLGTRKNYKLKPLSWPHLLQVDPGYEFKRTLQKLASIHDIICHREVGVHRDLSIVERWNLILTEWLLGHQYAAKLSELVWDSQLPVQIFDLLVMLFLILGDEEMVDPSTVFDDLCTKTPTSQLYMFRANLFCRSNLSSWVVGWGH